MKQYLLIVLAIMTGLPALAHAQTRNLGGGTFTFSNIAPITINDNSAGSPYPSVIQVSNTELVVTGVKVRLNNLSHTYPRDLDIILEKTVGANDLRSILISDGGGGNPGASGVSWTFSSVSPPIL